MSAQRNGSYAVALMLSAVVLIGGFTVAVKPKNEDRAELASKIQVQQEYTAALGAQRVAAQSTVENLEQLKADVSDFNKVFPAATNHEVLLVELENAAKKAGVDIVSMAPSTPAPLEEMTTQLQDDENALAELEGREPIVIETPAYTTMGVELNAAGSPDGLKKFAANVEGMERKLLINSSDFSLGSGPSVGMRLTALVMAPLNIETPEKE